MERQQQKQYTEFIALLLKVIFMMHFHFRLIWNTIWRASARASPHSVFLVHANANIDTLTHSPYIHMTWLWFDDFDMDYTFVNRKIVNVVVNLDYRSKKTEKISVRVYDKSGMSTHVDENQMKVF